MRIVSQRASLSIPDELPVVQASLRKGRGTRDQIANIHWIIENQKNSRKISSTASLTMLKLLTV